jgi:hypothetical protein
MVNRVEDSNLANYTWKFNGLKSLPTQAPSSAYEEIRTNIELLESGWVTGPVKNWQQNNYRDTDVAGFYKPKSWFEKLIDKFKK